MDVLSLAFNDNVKITCAIMRSTVISETLSGNTQDQLLGAAYNDDWNQEYPASIRAAHGNASEPGLFTN